jgi:acylphosphatase
VTKALHGLVSGRVQGVYFRAFVREQATAAGLGGWARNLADGRVEVWLEGEDGAVDRVAAALSVGPPAARVDTVELTPTAPANPDGFHIG